MFISFLSKACFSNLLNPNSMTEEEILAAEEERKANLVGHEEFKILTSRVDVMDQSIGKIVGRVGFTASVHLRLFSFVTNSNLFQD